MLSRWQFHKQKTKRAALWIKLCGAGVVVTGLIALGTTMDALSEIVQVTDAGVAKGIVSHALAFPLAMWFLFLLSCVITYRAILHLNRCEQQGLALESTAQIGDLIEALVIQEQTASLLLIQELMPRLHAFGPSDATRLNWNHRRILYLLLLPHRPLNQLRIYDRELMLAVLHALTQIGDAGALPAVKRLAERSEYADVREAARSSLPILEDCLRRGKEYYTLLRPSNGSSDTDRLLRAAGDAPTEPQQLLRAATEERVPGIGCRVSENGENVQSVRTADHEGTEG